jgi:serine/threonine protein kinase/DNA-binding beta-propeller fold protein YncE
MGEVYVADDLNLNRKVALKFLPDAFAADPERMARFEREARLLASLNHPSIAAIYGLEQAEGKRFLVLELVEGETLAQRIAKGPLPVEEALAICRQIAEGLEAAHEKGVIHRDLKPANVMITAGDKVKILDFGLAKALSDETQSVDSSQSPTLTEAMTRPGVILGTAAYMSPEQAKGKSVDKRADIWAFGCIFYECLTGKRVFEGETVTETLAAVLTREPEWEKAPARLHPLLRRCLEKDPKKRLRDIGDAMPLLEGLSESISAKQARLWLPWSIAAALLLAFSFLAFVHFREKSSVAEAVRFQIALPDKVDVGPGYAFALSPDGRNLAFSAADSSGSARLWIRQLDSLENRPLFGTESSSTASKFFWSPDSRFIAFEAGGKLKRIDIAGGPARTICDLSGKLGGGSWSQEGVILFGDIIGGSTLMRVPAEGGIPMPATSVNAARKQLAHASPVFLPDGRHFLYFCYSGTLTNAGAYFGSLESKPEEQSSEPLRVAMDSQFVYAPSRDSDLGYLLFLRNKTLMAQLFDEKRLQPVGDPVSVAENVASFEGSAFFSASTNNSLVYKSSGGQSSQLNWFDRQGKSLGKGGESGAYSGLALSPDGTRAAVAVGQTGLVSNIFLVDFLHDISTRFTFGQYDAGKPVWSSDGSRVIFTVNREGQYDLYQKVKSGLKNEEPLLKTDRPKDPTGCSSDGRFLLYGSSDPKTKYDIWLLPLEGGSKERPFLRTEFNEFDAHFSPDMRWVAYVSDETGRDEIYVRGFSRVSGEASPEAGGRWQISREGGTGPRWRGDGKELYYRAPDGKVMVVEINTDAVFSTGAPKPLFQAPPEILQSSATGLYRNWDVTSDGKRFLLSIPVAENSPSPFIVILNWTALLKK